MLLLHRGEMEVTVDLKELVDELQLRDVASPMLLRYSRIFWEQPY